MFFKKIVLAVLCIAFLPLSVLATQDVSVGARNACLMDMRTGKVLFAVRENQRRGMASTTKIMTALVAIESLPLDTVIKVKEEACHVEGSSVYLQPDEEITLETLLYALMLQSANDAACAIAYAVAGDIPTFAAMMNEKAETLGLADTHFENPHGLDGENHYTTAKELAMLTGYAMQNPVFREIVGTEKKIISLHDGKEKRLLVNHNRLLREYDDIVGVKTGFTKKCGRTLVSAATRNGLTLIAVTLNDGDDWRDHRKMLDYGFSLYHQVTLAENGMYRGKIPVCGGNKSFVPIVSDGELCAMVKSDCRNIKTVIEMPRFLYADVKKNQTVGHLLFYGDGQYLGKIPLKSTADSHYTEKEKSWIVKLFSKWFGGQ